jgi:plasmid segregation protein ParM
MELLGIDIGFGFTKATDGTDMVVFKSIYGEATDIQFWADFTRSSLTDYFHVTIDGRSYFIGDLAEKQSTVRHFTLNQEQLIANFIKILALTVVGIFQKKDLPVGEPINVVSGLPTGYYKQNRERFSRILAGRHSISYHLPDGSVTTKDIYIDKVRLLPQPMGSVLNLLMDDNGRITNTELSGQKLGVVDIGFRTTDFTILDNLRYIDRGSRTFDVGISNAFNVIADRLREKCGVAIELYRLYKAVDAGSIKIRGQELNFSKIRDQVFRQLAVKIATDIERLWADDWDIDAIVLTGGGSLELAEHLKPLVTGNVLPVTRGADARLNNVLGYLKYGRHLWGDMERTDEPAH